MSKPELTLITGGKSNVPIDLIDELFEPAAKALQDRSHRRPPTTFARSAFSTWAHDTAHDNYAIEISLAHKVGSEVERAYRRGDLVEKRRRLMAAWAEYCTSPPTTADIVPLRSGA
jgi:hypothetical protein